MYVDINEYCHKGPFCLLTCSLSIISEKMDYQLRGIPTVRQRETMVMEVAQSLSKVASVLLQVSSRISTYIFGGFKLIYLPFTIIAPIYIFFYFGHLADY